MKTKNKLNAILIINCKFIIISKIVMITTLLLLINTNISIAQREGANWHFGTKVGLYFDINNNLINTNSDISTREGSASISDKEGNLLFYTDGKLVFDKNHNIMPNGKSLNGNSTSTQSALIAKQPMSNKFYYIFTVDSNDKVGVNYSIVDISINNNIGDVIDKNILLFKKSTEKIAATLHANQIDIWIVFHEFGNNHFRSYLLTKDGLDPNPIISKVGSEHLPESWNTESKIGQMKINPQGNKLGLVKYRSNEVELFDFDNVTGIVSNAISIGTILNQGNVTFNNPNVIFSYPYGCEFSPNGELFYFSSNKVFQIEHKKITGFEKGTEFRNWTKEINFYGIGAMQLGIDGKLYKAGEASYLNSDNKYYTKLDCYETPNEIATSPTFNITEIQFPFGLNKDVRLGLPSMISSFFRPDYIENIVKNKYNIKIYSKDTADYPGYYKLCLPIFIEGKLIEGTSNNDTVDLELIVKVNKFLFSAVTRWNQNITKIDTLDENLIISLKFDKINLPNSDKPIFLGNLCGYLLYNDFKMTLLEIIDYKWIKKDNIDIVTEIGTNEIKVLDVCIDNIRKFALFEYPSLDLKYEQNEPKIKFESNEIGIFNLKIYNILGEELYSESFTNLSNNKFYKNIIINNIPILKDNNLYLFTINTPNIILTKKILK